MLWGGKWGMLRTVSERRMVGWDAKGGRRKKGEVPMSADDEQISNHTTRASQTAFARSKRRRRR